MTSDSFLPSNVETSLLEWVRSNNWADLGDAFRAGWKAALSSNEARAVITRKPVSGERHLFSCAKIKDISYYDTCDCGASAHETTVPFPYPCDKVGWICSICHQWNLPKDNFCSHTPRPAPDSPVAETSAPLCAICDHFEAVHGQFNLQHTFSPKASTDDIPAHSLAAFAAGCQCQWCTITRSAENGKPEHG